MGLADLSRYAFARPHAVAEACELLATRASKALPTTLLSGGTDWFVERHTAPAMDLETEPPLVVDVSGLAELTRIEWSGRTVRIGAAVPYATLRKDPSIASRLPLLSAMSKDVGAVQIQARGTLGGNLGTASPAADGVAALAALDARIVLTSVRGRRSVPIAAFLTGYRTTAREVDELIAEVEIDVPEPGSTWFWRKVGTRLAQAISKVALAAVASGAGERLTRVGLGMASVLPVTAFLPSVRELLATTTPEAIADGPLDEATVRDIAPIDDVRSTASYRRHVAKALVRNFVHTVLADRAQRARS